MAGHQRPLFVLFGASLTENSFQPGGWGASLADYYSRKADILLRGFRGWNTRRAVAVLEKFFPKDYPSQPALVIVFFGVNDAAFPLPSGKGQHVPLPEYKANLRQICAHIKGLSDTSRVVLITPPPVFEEARRAHARRKWGSQAGSYPDRTNERAQGYAEACLEVAKEMDVGAVDLWNAIQTTRDWETECLSDGLHLSPIGNQILLEELLKVLKSANWVPNLHWESLPNDFDETSIYDYVHPSEELASNDFQQPAVQ
uniref:Uncharacterized protein n=1 Tax=Araucaria cunninghamii TaxID=56994 RepID=A0A0D6R747_ARACU